MHAPERKPIPPHLSQQGRSPQYKIAVESWSHVPPCTGTTCDHWTNTNLDTDTADDDDDDNDDIDDYDDDDGDDDLTMTTHSHDNLQC